MIFYYDYALCLPHEESNESQVHALYLAASAASEPERVSGEKEPYGLAEEWSEP